MCAYMGGEECMRMCQKKNGAREWKNKGAKTKQNLLGVDIRREGMNRSWMRQVAPVLWCYVAACLLVASGAASASDNTSTNNWAVILSSSRFFFNIRHTANALTIYHLLRKHGIDDDHIVLLLGEIYACDSRNPVPSSVYTPFTGVEETNLYDSSVQVDYTGYDVDVRRFLGLLQGRYDENTPPSRRLNTDENSNILVYICGHSAEQFFKFQDSQFMGADDISDTVMMMWLQRRYHKLVLLVDTCHALSLCLNIQAPNVICLTSSDALLESYSRDTDPNTGLSSISQWTFEAQHLLEYAKCSKETHEQTGLQMSWFEFNYGEERKRVPPPLSVPSHFDAVNEPNAIHQWKVEEFFCNSDWKTTPLQVRYDIL